MQIKRPKKNTKDISVTITSLPIISIQNAPTTVTQGHSFSFDLNVAPPPVNPLIISLGVDDGGSNTLMKFYWRWYTTHTTGMGNVTIPNFW